MSQRKPHPAAALTVALCAGVFAATAEEAAAQPPKTVVVVSPVIEQEVSAGQVFVGTVEPLRTAVIGSAVAGRVVEFPINEGDRIGSGGTLAQLLTATIKLELAAAEAELDLRKQELLELSNGTLAEDIEQAEARMLAAQATQSYQEKRSQRLQSLGASAAREEREEADAAAKTSAQEYRRANAAYKLAILGPRAERIAQARAKVAVQQANIDLLTDRIRKYTVVCRFDGYVVAEHTEVGEWLQVGDPVAEVAALDEVEIDAQVVENHVPFIRQGASVRVEIPALAGKVFTGTVSSIASQGDIRSRTFSVRVRVANTVTEQGPLIKAGMSPRVTLPTGRKQQALLVSKDAIVLGGAEPTVFIVVRNSGEPVAQPVPVRLGVARGPLIQILGDIAAGAEVIVQGNERVRPGQVVTVSTAARKTNGPPRRPRP